MVELKYHLEHPWLFQKLVNPLIAYWLRMSNFLLDTFINYQIVAIEDFLINV